MMNYEEPIMEIILFHTYNVVTASLVVDDSASSEGEDYEGETFDGLF